MALSDIFDDARVAFTASSRVHLQRTKGWRMPPNTRKVDRSTVFGNPFDVGKYGVEDAVGLHRTWLTGAITDEDIKARFPRIVANHLIARRRRVLASLHVLRGKNLACGCPPSKACHADLLLELANRIETARMRSSSTMQSESVLWRQPI